MSVRESWINQRQNITLTGRESLSTITGVT
jgi:hypothetical protein